MNLVQLEKLEAKTEKNEIFEWKLIYPFNSLDYYENVSVLC